MVVCYCYWLATKTSLVEMVFLGFVWEIDFLWKLVMTLVCSIVTSVVEKRPLVAAVVVVMFVVVNRN
jgi:hypothetical protein